MSKIEVIHPNDLAIRLLNKEFIENVEDFTADEVKERIPPIHPFSILKDGTIIFVSSLAEETEESKRWWNNEAG